MLLSILNTYKIITHMRTRVIKYNYNNNSVVRNTTNYIITWVRFPQSIN